VLELNKQTLTSKNVAKPKKLKEIQFNFSSLGKTVFSSLRSGLSFLENPKFKSHAQKLAVTSLIAFFLLIALLVLLAPAVEVNFRLYDDDIPGMTQRVFNISHFVIEEWPFILGSLSVMVLPLWLFFSKISVGRFLWKKLVNFMPRSEMFWEIIVYGAILILFSLVWLPIMLPFANMTIK